MRRACLFLLILVFSIVLMSCTEDTLIVTLDPMGGVLSNVELVDIKQNSTLDLSSYIPTKEHNTFAYWYYLEGDLEVQFLASTLISASITLYAKWITDVYTIQFDTDEGTPISSQTYEYNELFVLPEAPRKDYHSFSGWTYLGEPIVADTPITSSMTLVASWDSIYSTTGSFRTYVIQFQNFNIHQVLNEASVEFVQLITDTLYKKDFDWDLAISLGIAEYEKDFSQADKLPITYAPSMAVGNPIDVDGDGLVWRINLRNDLAFEDGTPITSETFRYAWGQLLDPALAYENAYLLYDQAYLPLINAKEYAEQSIFLMGDEVVVLFSEVGFTIIDQYSFELHLESTKDVNDIKLVLSYLALGVVDEEQYELGMNNDGTFTDYGTISKTPSSYGPYLLEEWIDGESLTFTKNEDYFNSSSSYLIPEIYVYIENDSTPIYQINDDLYQMYLDDEIDVSPVPGDAYEVMNEPNSKYQPLTTFFRLAINLDYGNDGDPSNDNPFLQYIEMRQALYFGLDREYFTGIRNPSLPQQGLLGPSYFSHIGNPLSYRESSQGQSVLTDYAPETCGYDPVRALELFNIAYQKAIDDGLISDGEKIEITLVYSSETSVNPYSYFKQLYESVFGTDRFTLILDNRPLYSLINDDFDLFFAGWQGEQYNAPSLLIVYLSGEEYIIESGYDTSSIVTDVNLPNLKIAVIEWISEINSRIGSLDEVDLANLEAYETILSKFNGDVYTDTMENLILDFYWFMVDHSYSGREIDFDSLAAALETELLEQMMMVPLITSVGYNIYREQIGFRVSLYNAAMGYGGYQYMYIKA
ncbi:MAG: ABC transporter substrate-binding protein [Candidatus Izemoplasmatales bacterium]|nr:ABC transporter substrate-binding protein [Candidatus Izemoplasmatales bacterium]